ncbi:MAG TPA: Imm5 family immunity protein [Pseudonocardiaceae bacterium]|nr:Imm5 family immunity protein [Pseudonocardiaceae bacterium]
MTVTDNGEPGYADRMRIRAEVAANGVDALLRLEELCARRACRAWQARFPHDDEPMALLTQALRDRDPALTRALNALHTKLDDAMEPDAFTAVYAGFACLTTARHAVAGEIHDRRAATGEIEVPPTEWTPCYLASLAEAGGATWEPDTDTAARRAYWRWYLDTAATVTA